MNFKRTRQLKSGLMATSMLVALAGATNSHAFSADVTLIQISDIHGALVPHAGTVHHADGTETFHPAVGGLANIKGVINDIKATNPDALVINVGDMTHGTAETLFTVGDAIMPGLNALGIDVSVPGNWDFGHGPAVFRHRFIASVPSTPTSCQLPANIRLMSDSEGVGCVTKATFPNVANNVFNDFETLPPMFLPGATHNGPILPPYKKFTVGGITVAVIGITASIVPEQADVFNIGLRFSQGIKELEANIAMAKMPGPPAPHPLAGPPADVIVVASELGLPQNIQIGRDFADVDVVLSGHTHEITHGAIIADKNKILSHDPLNPNSTAKERRLLKKGGTIVVEAGEDFDIGKLQLDIGAGGVVDYRWSIEQAIQGTVTPDAAVAAAVGPQEAQFTGGPGGPGTFPFHPHIVMPAGFCGSPNPAQNPLGLTPCFVQDPAEPPGVMMPNPVVVGGGGNPGRGLSLTEPLDTVVGTTDTLLRRHDDLETVWNNFIADAVHSITNGVTTVDIAMTGGFRFGNDILPGNITLRDLYSHFPIAPAVSVAEFSGKAIEESMNDNLDSVFNRNPFEQRGGWYVGMANMSQDIDLDNRPFGTSGGRIVKTMIGAAPLDRSKRYTFASCYAHGNSLDNVCRTPGGSNHQFFELANKFDYSSPLTLVAPLNTTGIIAGPNVKQVAPDKFLSPVHVLRRYLDNIGGAIVGASYATGRVQTVDSTVFPAVPVAAPVSAILPGAIQLPEGAGRNHLPVNVKK